MMSHLSDAQELSGFYPKNCNTHINFVKFLILKYSDIGMDLTSEVDPEDEWKEFATKHPNLINN